MCAYISRLRPDGSLGRGNQHPTNYSPVRMLAWEKRCQSRGGAQPSRQKARSHAQDPLSDRAGPQPEASSIGKDPTLWYQETILAAQPLPAPPC